ncbi:hypothetical protein [Veillonella caviae]|uniref:hypothetical protein n=1 Tax=Veillonella caviae TaxID=248316 RepID=UPI0023A89CBB|nr:hypothetical protein [Veillonella caviae]MCI5708704.1 hypothetical protein [Veillonella caviae]MCI6406351.1 hypothetical protein [Veillonella caviae]MDD7291436.1 hypothetical protein [Veillonella caviae]MDY4745917.1 hypothetical protein [Veillonella caviae]MDY5715985.1 hypothetical protein [Veillonella caviae]
MYKLTDLRNNIIEIFETKGQASDYASIMGFGFQWRLYDAHTNELVAQHIYE